MRSSLKFESIFNLLGKRSPTMKTCFEILKGRRGEISILELGTTRSFSSGVINTQKFDDNPDNWDWGAGCFTSAIKTLLPHCSLTSVDPNGEAIKVSRQILDALGHQARFVQEQSTNFLAETRDSYDLIYMDHAESGENDSCAILHRNDAGLILRNKIIKPDGLILIDDIQTKYNKGMYSIPFLEECGLSYLSKNTYQVLFRNELNA